MQGKSRLELYHLFIEFIGKDAQHERGAANRRMFLLFFWCFVVPAALSLLLLFLFKLGLIHVSVRVYVDSIILGFPILYSIYILGSEVMTAIPAAFKRGGIASSLHSSVRESTWREKTCASMEQAVQASVRDWDWIVGSFEIDLQNLRYRTRYLTALAGAVLFLIMQGIDSVVGGDPEITWIKNPIFGWFESSSNDFSEYIGLGLFLVVFYLSGNQSLFSLNRYLDCAKLIRDRIKER